MPSLLLETFTDTPEAEAAPAVATATDEARLAGFDAGYAAGWDDAAKAHAEDRHLAEARLSEALHSMGFTFQEARHHILTALEPLLHDAMARILPRVAQQALPALVAEQLMPLAGKLADTPVTLRLHPDTRAGVEAACLPTLGLPLAIVEDPALTPGDIRLAFATGETRIDTDSAVAAIAAAVADFFTLETKAQTHAG